MRVHYVLAIVLLMPAFLAISGCGAIEQMKKDQHAHWSTYPSVVLCQRLMDGDLNEGDNQLIGSSEGAVARVLQERGEDCSGVSASTKIIVKEHND